MLIEQTVKWIGFASHAANNQKESPHRDVDTTHRTTMEAKKERRLKREARGAAKKKTCAVRTEAMGGHALRRQADGKWNCDTCRKTSKRWNWIALAATADIMR